MKSVGVICECNPFHSGHKYLIEQARAGGADAVVCVMSGYFTERGEAAIAEPYSRASALIAGGADLVVELPYPYSASGAEFFADAGVNVLSRLGVSALCFGSECGDLAPLFEAARISLSEEFLRLYTERTTEAKGAAQAYFELLESMCGGDVHFSSNDILGISYLRALIKQGSNMIPATVKREGSAYLDEALPQNGHPSATALRRRLLADPIEASLPYLLPETEASLKEAQGESTFPADLSFAERAILTALRMQSTDSLSALAELDGGLGNRLIESAVRADSLERLLELAATKKYTNSRLRRGILYAMTGVKKEDLIAPPAHVRLLAANRVGCALLAQMRRDGALPVVTRVADIPKTPESARQEELHARALSLYSACLKNPVSPPALLAKKPRILK